MKILSKILLVIFICIMCGSYNVYGDDSVSGDTSKGLPEINTNLVPSADVSGDAKTFVEVALGALQVVGIVAVVVGIGLIGFNTILGSASEKAVAQEKYVGIVIAAIIITAGSTIAQFLIQAAENL